MSTDHLVIVAVQQALELCSMLYLPAAYDAACTIANYHRMPALAERMLLLKETVEERDAMAHNALQPSSNATDTSMSHRASSSSSSSAIPASHASTGGGGSGGISSNLMHLIKQEEEENAARVNTSPPAKELHLATGLDAVYASSMRRIVYPYYRMAWPHISRALGMLLGGQVDMAVDAFEDDVHVASLYGLCLWEMADEANERAVIVSCMQMVHGLLERQRHNNTTTEPFEALHAELVAVLYRASRAFPALHSSCQLCRWLIEHGSDALSVSLIKILAAMSQPTPSMTDLLEHTVLVAGQLPSLLTMMKQHLARIVPLVDGSSQTTSVLFRASAVFLRERIHAATKMAGEHGMTILTLSVASLSYLLDVPSMQEELRQVYHTVLGRGTEEKRLRGADCLAVTQLDVAVLEALRTMTVLVLDPAMASKANPLSILLVTALPWLDYIDVSVRHAVAEWLLALAAEQATAFRQALANLPAEQAGQLETALRQFAVERQAATTATSQSVPSKIELKSAFTF
ncbi:hypothetical protein SYNPS1DRAFT_30165 [Syncephalis pseudoplumigaleata]|uniref:Armadillo-type protein n=1 Tax=Syncephalis pseudoplumigaleata TaxID=1712513 RepID=A0A4P9YVK3_9FUNG|nr:hypothetical protein SYNPS1DRAFT_30165 [Syncephalis pseudoplumigaleata]|eukprot:RKP24066.1 hypothetical protein SYNPS1DRAFT_30165 [Syncephalis pseudoplumigaleata]